VIKWRIRWEKHAARIGKMRNIYKIYVKGLNGRDNRGDISEDRRIVLKCILKN
jgi:hypothetical protein